MGVEASPHSQNPPSGGFGRGPTSAAFGPTDESLPEPSRLRPFIWFAVGAALVTTLMAMFIAYR